MTILDTKKFSVALAFANNCHEGQYRKGTTIPYISHPMQVAALCLENGGSQDQVIAALLHDTLEDCYYDELEKDITELFGENVLRIVRALSDTVGTEDKEKPPWVRRKQDYMKHLENQDEEVLLVSLCDKFHNFSCIQRDFYEHGDKLWDRFNAEPEQILWYYDRLLKIFSQRIPDCKLVEELDMIFLTFEDYDISPDGHPIKKESKDPVFDKALMLYREGDFESLYAYCQKVTQENIDNLELWKLYGVAAGMMGDTRTARICGETVFKLQPEDQNNIVNLITSYFHSGMPERACEMITEHGMSIRNEAFEILAYTMVEAMGEYNEWDMRQFIPKDFHERIYAFVRDRNLTLEKTLRMVEGLKFEKKDYDFIFYTPGFNLTVTIPVKKVVRFYEATSPDGKFSVELNVSGHTVIFAPDEFVFEPKYEENSPFKQDGPQLVTQYDLQYAIEEWEKSKGNGLDREHKLWKIACAYIAGAKRVGADVKELEERVRY